MKNIFIFERIGQLSYNYHSEGGLVIIAKDIDEAKEIIKVDKNIQPTEEDWKEVKVYKLKEEVESRYFTFPDAGCC